MERNIYKIGKELFITSDEEIKENTKPCWCLDTKDNSVNYYQGALPLYNYIGYKKIILTDNKDLINDGVQPIDDEFLEWFVKNPSCEWVEVDRDEREVGNHLGGVVIEYGDYKIIIPKEEPKKIKCYCGHTITCDCSPLEESKQETLEEAAEKKYSKEDMISFAEFVATYTDKNKNVHGQMLHAKSKYDGAERTIDLFKIWYKQHKKK
jgi:hypothetical protein